MIDLDQMRAAQERRQRDRRERIATAALQGLLASGASQRYAFVGDAIYFADALIAKLDEEPQP